MPLNAAQERYEAEAPEVASREPAVPDRSGRGTAWAELLRVSAVFTVPGDALAGAAAIGRRPNRGTALAVCASLCLYEAGMALNDWADHDIDAIERPHRPLPSGRIAPRAAFAAAAGLTAAGLGFAAAAGRPALTAATALAGTVWAYDLHLKNTPAGPAAMATARSLDLLLGATATAAGGSSGARTPTPRHAGAARSGGAFPTALTPAGPGGAHAVRRDRARTATPGSTPGVRTASVARPASEPVSVRDAFAPAALLGAHTLAVTAVSRREAEGGSTAVPLVALAATALIGRALGRGGGPAARTAREGAPSATAPRRPPVSRTARTGTAGAGAALPAGRSGASALAAALAGAYAATAGRPFAHAVLNPSPYLTQRAVGGGIRAMIPLQAALAARAGAGGTAVAVLALLPVARRLSRKVSPT